MNSQQTKRYLELHKKLNLIEKVPDTVFYGNRKIKSIGTYANYKYKDIKYHGYIGKLTEYYKNGNISAEMLLDDYCNYLSAKFYDRKGRLWEEWETQEIDISEGSVEEYLKSNDNSNFKRKINNYNYSSKYKKWYICREDYLISRNNKKFETRTFYNALGDSLKTKEIKHKNK